MPISQTGLFFKFSINAILRFIHLFIINIFNEEMQTWRRPINHFFSGFFRVSSRNVIVYFLFIMLLRRRTQTSIHDIVNHNLLLRKLHHNGVSGIAKNLFLSFFSERKQYVFFIDHNLK